MSKTVNDYLSLPYSMVVRMDPVDGIFVAKVSELPGCSGHGDTAEDAIRMLTDNMAVWIETCLESGVSIPEPSRDEDLPSGKWLQRAPKTLHLALIELARKEDVSLNQIIVSILAQHIGHETAKQIAVPPQPESPKLADPWSRILDPFSMTTWQLHSDPKQFGDERLDMAFLEHLVKTVTASPKMKHESDSHDEKAKHNSWSN